MADSTLQPTIRPAVVEIIPVEDVVTITTHYDDLIRQLEAELDDATAEAEDAERGLRRHAAADVIDDDFESFVLWATQARLIEIHRDDPDRVPELDSASRRAPIPVDAVLAYDEPEIDPEPPARVDVEPPRVAEQPTVVTPTVAAPAPPPTRRSGRPANGTTVVTRPAPAPTSAPSVPAPQSESAVAPSSAAPRGDSFWQPARGRAEHVERADRPTRAERDAQRRIGRLPSTLMVQAGAVFVIVALLVLKLG